MTVSKEITRLEHSALKLTVSVGKDDVRTEYDAILNNYTKTLQIPGFRKGKVPKTVLERKFGESLKGEALGEIIEHALTHIFEDESFPKEDRPLPYSTPSLEDEPKLDLEADLNFSVKYDVLPKLTVGKRKGLEVEAPEAAVEDGDIARELEAVRERNAIVLDRDDGAAAVKDNVVTVNYTELSEDGSPVPGTEREDFVFTLGTGYNVYKFDDEVAGMKKGETKDIVKTYAEDLEDKELAGKTKKIRVTLTALKEKKLPDLDDDLAQDVDEKYQTLEDLKKSIRERLGRTLDRRLRELRISAILEKILETTPVDVPESMVRIELDSRWRNLARQFNTDAEGLARMMGNSEGGGRDGILEEWRPAALKALQSRLIVETLIRDLAFEASDEELEKEFTNIMEETGSTLEEVKKYYAQDNMRDYLKEDIKERKLFDVLLAENSIKPGKKTNYLDLVGNNG